MTGERKVFSVAASKLLLKAKRFEIHEDAPSAFQLLGLLSRVSSHKAHSSEFIPAQHFRLSIYFTLQLYYTIHYNEFLAPHNPKTFSRHTRLRIVSHCRDPPISWVGYVLTFLRGWLLWTFQNKRKKELRSIRYCWGKCNNIITVTTSTIWSLDARLLKPYLPMMKHVGRLSHGCIPTDAQCVNPLWRYTKEEVACFPISHTKVKRNDFLYHTIIL